MPHIPPRTSPTLSRRSFLRSATAAASGFLILPRRSALGYAANERLNLGIVGVSGYAAANAFVPALHIYDNVQITALCDVDQRKVAPAFELWKKRAQEWPGSDKPEERKGAAVYQRLHEQLPPLFADYREMLDKAHKDVDALVVATPDHSHAGPSALGMRAGKHVFTEKPLTVTVHEARALRDLAQQNNVATSMGNQGTQSPQFRRGLELIQEGALGEVEQVHVWFARGGRNHRQAPQGTQDVPPELDWDLWLGPVAARPYHPGWIARTHWRETSAGELGNFGPHTANLAFMALKIRELWELADAGVARAPIVVEAECSEINRLSFPVWERIHWHVPARGQLRPVKITWHQGPDYAPGSRQMLERLMREHGATDEDVKKLLVYAGAMILGSKGALVTDSHNVNITLLPKERFAEVRTDKPISAASSRGHYKDWIHACRGGERPWASFDYAATFNEFLMLGDVATRFAGEKLDYDPIAGRVINHAEANQALSYEYRQGWRL